MTQTMSILLTVQLQRRESSQKHQDLVKEVMSLPAIKVVEHPDLFVETSDYEMKDFDYIIELRENKTKKSIMKK